MAVSKYFHKSMNGISLGQGLVAVLVAAAVPSIVYAVGMFKWIAFMQLVLFPVGNLPYRDYLLDPHAGRVHNRVLDLLPRGVVAHPARLQGDHVSTVCQPDRRQSAAPLRARGFATKALRLPWRGVSVYEHGARAGEDHDGIPGAA